MSLERFGFTRTQDAVFLALLRRGGGTGYAIARAVGLARANVYQALDALVARGVATCSGGRPATYRAVEPATALSVLSRRAEEDLRILAAALGAATPAPAIHRTSAAGSVEVLTGPAALFSAAADAADAASHELLAVIGPWAPSVVAALERARLRGLSWKVVSLGAPALEGTVLRAVRPAELASYWGGLPVALVCDRSRAVCGIVSGEDANGMRTESAGLVPFLRHLLRRELATAGSPRVS